MSEEARRYRRFGVVVQCSITDGATSSVGSTRDLSKGGVALMLPIPYAISSRVELALALAFADGTCSAPLRLRATVVWCTRLGQRHQIGARFGKLPPADRSVLDSFLGELEETTEVDPEPMPTSRRSE